MSFITSYKFYVIILTRTRVMVILSQSTCAVMMSTEEDAVAAMRIAAIAKDRPVVADDDKTKVIINMDEMIDTVIEWMKTIIIE